jgi:hypothetical protein
MPSGAGDNTGGQAGARPPGPAARRLNQRLDHLPQLIADRPLHNEIGPTRVWMITSSTTSITH